MARKKTKTPTFGENIKRLRSELRLTQQGLADMVGTDKGHISRIESDEINPRLSTARALANALGVSLDSLSGN